MTQNTTRNKKTKEQLTLKDDVLFKAFFAKKGNEKYLKSFLEAILNVKIHKIKIEQEVNLYKLTIDEKPGRLDLQAIIDDGKIVDIEMQVKDEKNIEQRTLVYGSKLIAGQLKEGENYKNIKPVILINILGYNMFETKEYHTQTKTVLKENKEIEVIKDIQYHFIELPKFREAKPELTNLLECWLAFIDNRKGGLVEKAMVNETIIREAEEKINEILSNKELQEILRYRWSAKADEATRMENAKEEGMEQGLKKGMKKGMKQGIEKGIQQGIEKGAKEEKIENS